MARYLSQISASNHDCRLFVGFWDTWEFELDSPKVAVGFKHAFVHHQGSGLYFGNIGIPPGSTIAKASLNVTALENRVRFPVWSAIEIEDNVNPSPFTTLADFQARSWSVHIQHWLFERYGTNLKDHIYESPDFTPLIQHIIDEPGWQSGNSIVLSWHDFNNMSEGESGTDFVAYSYDKNPAKSIWLVIYYTPPPPPPWTPSHHFSTHDVTFTMLEDGFRIIVITDAPCHLYMRWSNVEPKIHDIPTWRRGIFMHGDRYFCFVAYHENEQEEDGDTLIHTFIKKNWTSCETRWFYFWGQQGTIFCKSTTAPFKLHFQAPGYKLAIREKWSYFDVKPPPYYLFLSEPWG